MLGSRQRESDRLTARRNYYAHDFYSYDAKYLDEKGAQLVIPAALPKSIVKAVQGLALRTFKTLACEGMARVDFFLRDNREIFVNEINTIPGFTKISMYPKLWEASGISYSKLIDRLIQLALERFRREKFENLALMRPGIGIMEKPILHRGPMGRPQSIDSIGRRRNRQPQSICFLKKVGMSYSSSSLSRPKSNVVLFKVSVSVSSLPCFLRCQVGVSKSSTMVPKCTTFLFFCGALAMLETFTGTGFRSSLSSPNPVAMTVIRISSVIVSSMTEPKMILASSCASSWIIDAASLTSCRQRSGPR